MNINTRRVTLILIAVSCTITMGVVLFTKGFLLNRIVVNKNSTCSITDIDRDIIDLSNIRISDILQFDNNSHTTCWPVQHFKKSLILVIDALRFDFLLFNAGTSKTEDKYYINKIPVINETLHNYPQSSILYRFIADPPTTTLQRLKALTTGSLPTFIDVGSNFATPEITEDNVIDRMVSNKRRIVFMGDDTWVGLFPTRFYKSYPFPSFNVHDLHTVDNGILEHLIPTIKSADWDVIIAHFLGVDHCGHRYGPNHSAMEEKLRQMNEMLRSVLESVDNDTVVIVFGDHGMTATGDHGGDSRHELDAGLFMFSKRRLVIKPHMLEHSVRQIDIVPTLSLLLGIPIPFSNLGKVMLNLFPACQNCDIEASRINQLFYSVYAVRHNAQQISRFLDEYQTLSQDVPATVFHDLKIKLRHMEFKFESLSNHLKTGNDSENILADLSLLIQEYSNYIDEIHEICSRIWAKFDFCLMILGIVTVASSLVITVKLFFYGFKNGITRSLYGSVITAFFSSFVCTCFAFTSSASSNYDIIYISTMVVHIALGCYVFCDYYAVTKSKLFRSFSAFDLDDYFALFITGLSCLSCLSNSFVVNQNKVLLYLLQTLIFTKIFKTIKVHIHKSGLPYANKKKYGKNRRKFDLFAVLTTAISASILTCFLLSFSVKLSQYFFSCREEQVGCVYVDLMQPVANLMSPSTKVRNAHYFFSIFALAILVYLPRLWLRRQGNLNGAGIFATCVRNCFPLSAICIALYWALQALPANTLDSLPSWQRVIFPRTVYCLIFTSVVLHAISPLSVYIVDRRKHDKLIETPLGATTVPAMFRHLKNVYDPRHNGATDLPLAYGLGTIYTASIVFLISSLYILLSMILGEGPSASLIVLFMTKYLLLEIHAHITNTTADTNDVPFSMIVMWSLLARLSFYSSAHQMSFQSLRWEAAFVGFHGDHSTNAVPALLLVLNTYGSYIVTMMAMPLLVTWPRVKARLLTAFEKQGDCSANEQGDFHLYNNPHDLWPAVLRLAVGMVIVQTLQVFGAMTAALVLRRHLMVWKVFAPAFLFEAIGTLVVFATVAVILLFLARLDRCVCKWVEKMSIKL